MLLILVLLTNLMGEFAILSYIENCSTRFFKSYHFYLGFTSLCCMLSHLIWLPKPLHKMIWNSLEEALDIILLWNTFSSLL